LRTGIQSISRIAGGLTLGVLDSPHYFQKVRISAVALIKMVMHARSGGIYEIMGLMQGKVDDKTQTMYIMDAFALPVEGTETRVNAQNDAYEYMVQYQDAGKSVSS
jgi:COP9 signalosome complex subunit 5